MRVSYHDDNPFESSFKREMGKGCAGCVAFLIWAAIIGAVIAALSVGGGNVAPPRGGGTTAPTPGSR